MDLGLNFEVVDEDTIEYDNDILDERIRRMQKEIESDLSFLEREISEKNDGDEDWWLIDLFFANVNQDFEITYLLLCMYVCLL